MKEDFKLVKKYNQMTGILLDDPYTLEFNEEFGRFAWVSAGDETGKYGTPIFVVSTLYQSRVAHWMAETIYTFEIKPTVEQVKELFKGLH
jgi:hypothetical protein